MKEMVHIYYDDFGNRTKNKKKAKFEYIEYSTEFWEKRKVEVNLIGENGERIEIPTLFLGNVVYDLWYSIYHI